MNRTSVILAAVIALLFSFTANVLLAVVAYLHLLEIKSLRAEKVALEELVRSTHAGTSFGRSHSESGMESPLIITKDDIDRLMNRDHKE
jgi:hypothetical protein